jgi:hypothetical protein
MSWRPGRLRKLLRHHRRRHSRAQYPALLFPLVQYRSLVLLSSQASRRAPLLRPVPKAHGRWPVSRKRVPLFRLGPIWFNASNSNLVPCRVRLSRPFRAPARLLVRLPRLASRSIAVPFVPASH